VVTNDLSIATIESGDKVTVTGVEIDHNSQCLQTDFISIGSQDFQLPPNIKKPKCIYK
jgi:hypothetical protein